MNAPNEGESQVRGEVMGDSKGPRKMAELQKTITMAQIAKAAGVSQGAISSLLNDRDYGIRVSEKTRERVFKVCREMGYIPNDLRAVVRMYPELGDFCLLIATRRQGGLADSFVSRIAGAAMAATTEESRSITIGCYEETRDYSGDPDHLPHPLRAGVASKFVLLGAPNSTLLQALVKRGLSAISLGYDAAQTGVVSLVPDFQNASRLAIEQLLRLGHQNIAIVSGPFGATDSQIIELNRGVRLAFEGAGSAMEAQNIIYGDLTHGAGVAAFDALMAREPRPTAVFCMSDAVAAGIIAAGQRRGFKVPDDLSVIGCGDDAFAQCLSPALTTIHIPAEEMAARAIGEVARLVHEGEIGTAKKEVLPVRLVERGSCGGVGKK